jgi:hypothetical protein
MHVLKTLVQKPKIKALVHFRILFYICISFIDSDMMPTIEKY